MVRYEIVGKCKNCGAEFDWIAYPDSLERLEYSAYCPQCGQHPSSADIERFYHLVDTVDTVDARNGFGTLSKIVIYHVKGFN